MRFRPSGDVTKMNGKSNSKRLIIAIVIINVILFISAIVIIQHKNVMKTEEIRLAKHMIRLSDGLVSLGANLSKQEVLQALVTNRHMMINRRISDSDLDRVIYLTNKSFSKDHTGRALILFFDGLKAKPALTPAQKDKIGKLCVTVAENATDDNNRAAALAMLRSLRINTYNSQISYMVNDKNTMVSKFARKIISSR